VANGELLVENRNDVAVLTLNRPSKGNALTASMLEKLTGELASLAEGEKAKCVVLRGAGEKFSVGMDLNAMAECTPTDNQELIGAGGPLRLAISGIEEFPFPVIAMIRGHAAGAACELATSCDLRAGSSSSRMGMPPARLGIVYPPEGLERFVRTYGLAVARKLFYTARYFEGRELYMMGMLDFFVTDDELEPFTMELASRLTRNAPLSMRGHKRTLALIAGQEAAPAEALSEIMGMVSGAIASDDAVEGIRAFQEKRAPKWR
jgi:enoyl-CoA hydratase/carnithine racemase